MRRTFDKGLLVGIGLVVALVGCIFAAWLVLLVVARGVDVPGYASIMVAVLVLGGLQLLSLGLIGEYVGRLYMETKQRPAYLVSDVVGGPLGRSPKDEILRVRLNRAKQLLAQTDFSLAMVTKKVGFEHTEYLSVIFKKKTGLTPGQFRNQSRVTEAADRLPTPKLNSTRS